MKIESSIRQINHPQQAVYDMLSDLGNIERFRSRLPQDKVQGLAFTADSVSVKTQLGEVTMNVVEREEPKMIKFETAQSPVPLTFWIQVLPVDEATSKMKLTARADTNPLVSSMLRQPLRDGLERIADVLQSIDYQEAKA